MLSNILGKSLSSSLQWNENKDVKFHLINKKTSEKYHIKYVTKAKMAMSNIISNDNIAYSLKFKSCH